MSLTSVKWILGGTFLVGCLFLVGGLPLLSPSSAATAQEKKTDAEGDPLSTSTGKVKKGSFKPPSENIEHVQKTIKLPHTLKDGPLDGGKLFYKKLNGVGYIWAPIGILSAGQTGAMTFTNVPGTAPVAGCFCEWDVANNQPHFGDARMVLLEVARRNGEARISGFQNYGNLNCAMGLIVAD